MKMAKNRFNVQVYMPPSTFGITNRPDVEVTPLDVARCLEEFCRRIRNGGHMLLDDAESAEARAPQGQEE